MGKAHVNLKLSFYFAHKILSPDKSKTVYGCQYSR